MDQGREVRPRNKTNALLISFYFACVTTKPSSVSRIMVEARELGLMKKRLLLVHSSILGAAHVVTGTEHNEKRNLGHLQRKEKKKKAAYVVMRGQCLVY